MSEAIAHSIHSFLEENEIASVIINKMDSMHLHLTNGEVEIHVNQENVIRAKHLITNFLKQ